MSTNVTILEKKWISNTLIISFMILVAFSAFLSEVLKAPAKKTTEIIEQSLVFNSKELESVNKISLKNKSGEYIFERASLEVGSPWSMTSPKTVASGSVFIDKLFSNLITIKTKKYLPDTNSNSLNFSLDKPTATITLTDKNQKSYSLNIGIMNTIDQSTYVRISERKGIYHIEAPSESLENITINDLIESRIFDFNSSNISAFKITKKSSASPVIDLILRENSWTSNEGKTYNTKKVEEFLNDFFKIKSTLALDQQTEPQKKQTQKLLTTPDYRINIEMTDGKKINYLVSTPTKSLVDKALNDVPHILISDTESSIVFVINNENASFFDIKADLIKSLEEQTPN